MRLERERERSACWRRVSAALSLDEIQLAMAVSDSAGFPGFLERESHALRHCVTVFFISLFLQREREDVMLTSEVEIQ